MPGRRRGDSIRAGDGALVTARVSARPAFADEELREYRPARRKTTDEAEAGALEERLILLRRPWSSLSHGEEIELKVCPSDSRAMARVSHRLGEQEATSGAKRVVGCAQYGAGGRVVVVVEHADERYGVDGTRERRLEEVPARHGGSGERRVGKGCRSRWSPDH